MNTKSQHTPGPWKVRIHGNFQQSILDSIGTRILAMVDNTDNQDKANAHLIAAAPELLEACKAALDYAEGNVKHVGEIETRKILNSAIAKAERKV